jgi:hypothetical protein
LVPRVDAYVLVGVTSKGTGCADPAFPGVYARLGVAALNAWVRDRIPTVRIDSAALTRWPAVNENVTLTAIGTRGLYAPPDPGVQWSVSNLDGDCAIVGLSGANATLRPSKPGSCAITAQQVYPDGDHALAREVITTSGSPGPHPPPPPPGAPAPPAPRPPAPDPAPPAPAPAPAAPVLPAPASEEALPAALEPAPPPPPAPRAQTRPRLATLVMPRQIKVSDLLDGRFSVTVRCSAACRLTAAMRLDSHASKTSGLTRKLGHGARLGSGSARRSTAGRVRLTLRVPRAARIWLRSARSRKLTLFITAIGSKRTASYTRIIELSR